MPLSRIVNNVGVGAVEGTFINLTTTVASKQGRPFTQAMIDTYRRACTIMGNYYVGWGTTTAALFGSVVAASDQSLTAKGFPSKLVVVIQGCAEIQGTTGAAAPSAVLGAVRPPFQILGCVAQGTTTPAAAMLHSTKGQIINVYNTDRCVVSL